MPHHILCPEIDNGNTFYIPYQIDSAHQPGVFFVGQVYLGGVTGDDKLGVAAHAGEEHLQLSQGGVLGLVQDDEGTVQGPAPHIGQRRYLNDALLHEYLQLAWVDHVVQGIVQGLEVGVQLLLHVAGQESQSLAGLHCRAGEYQFLHLFVLQGSDGQCDGRVCLACACRAEGEDKVVLIVFVHQPALVAGAGLTML